MPPTNLLHLFPREPDQVLTVDGRVYRTPQGMDPCERLAFLAGIEAARRERSRPERLSEALAAAVTRISRNDAALKFAIATGLGLIYLTALGFGAVSTLFFCGVIL